MLTMPRCEHDDRTIRPRLQMAYRSDLMAKLIRKVSLLTILGGKRLG
jgi:hypothetical protein